MNPLPRLLTALTSMPWGHESQASSSTSSLPVPTQNYGTSPRNEPVSPRTSPDTQGGRPVCANPGCRWPHLPLWESVMRLESPSPALQSLYTERDYLTKALDAEEAQLKKLCSDMLAASNRFLGSPTPSETRKLRKKIQSIERATQQGFQQEKAILVRLSDIYIDIQSQERWYEIHQRRDSPTQHALPQYCPHSPTPSATAPVNHSRSSTTSESHSAVSCLSPLSPVFVPGRNFSWPLPGAEEPRDGTEAAAGQLAVAEEEDTVDQEADTGASARFIKSLLPVLRWEFDDREPQYPRSLSQRRRSLPRLMSVEDTPEASTSNG